MSQKFKHLILLDFEKDFFSRHFLEQLELYAEKWSILKQNSASFKTHSEQVDGLVVRYFTSLNEKDLVRLLHLKYIGASSVSLDQIDLNHAKKKGIVVKNIPGYSTESVTEFIFGALLAKMRHLNSALKNSKQGDFDVHKSYQGVELKDKTFGILGLGNIGQRVSEIAQAFGMRVQYHSRTRKKAQEKKGVKYVNLPELFATSHVIGIFLELNEQTKAFVSKESLNLIQNETVVISISHTNIFDFSELKKALQEKDFSLIQTYFSTIPKRQRDQLVQLPNATLYPSLGVQTREAKQRMETMILDNVANFLQAQKRSVAE